MQYPGVMDFIKRYQERAKAAGVDPIGNYAAPWAYAELQILGQAVEATKSTAGEKLGPYIHATTFKTIIADVKFGESGEWAQPRMLAAQFQHVKGNDIEQLRARIKWSLSRPPSTKAANYFRSKTRAVDRIKGHLAFGSRRAQWRELIQQKSMGLGGA
jgi:branched-chain amino acid transport system substrate-binding protein